MLASLEMKSRRCRARRFGEFWDGRENHKTPTLRPGVEKCRRRGCLTAQSRRHKQRCTAPPRFSQKENVSNKMRKTLRHAGRAGAASLQPPSVAARHNQAGGDQRRLPRTVGRLQPIAVAVCAPCRLVLWSRGAPVAAKYYKYGKCLHSRGCWANPHSRRLCSVRARAAAGLAQPEWATGGWGRGCGA